MLQLVASFLLGHIVLLLAGTIPLLYLYATRGQRYWEKQGVKGPKAWPIIGSFFSLFNPISSLYLDYMKRFGKIYGIYQGQTPVLVVSEPEVIKRILVKDFHLFHNRVPFAQEPRTSPVHTNLVDARDDSWKRIRSIITTMFTTSKLKKMEPQMNSCTAAMLQSFENLATAGEEFVAHDAMGKFTMNVIAKCAFATETTPSFVANAKLLLNFRMIPFLFSQVIPFWIYKLMHLVRLPYLTTNGAQFFVKLSGHLLGTRKAMQSKGMSPTEDLLQLMINAEYKQDHEVEKEDLLEAHHVSATNEDLEREKKYFSDIIGSKFLTPAEIITNSIVFFIAGYETTASTLAFCLFELASNPAVQSRLYDEIQKAKSRDPSLSYATLQSLPYLDSVLCETLRKYPPAVTVINRECDVDEYAIPEAGATLHKGDVVLFPVYAIHHAEEFHPEPTRFNPDRFLPENRDRIIPYTYLPFGVGPRNCVGMRFALKEAKIGLANLVDRFEVRPTARTPAKLKLGLCTAILKTEPIRLCAVKRE